jgi:hypothetical protein
VIGSWALVYGEPTFAKVVEAPTITCRKDCLAVPAIRVSPFGKVQKLKSSFVMLLLMSW